MDLKTQKEFAQAGNMDDDHMAGLVAGGLLAKELGIRPFQKYDEQMELATFCMHAAKNMEDILDERGHSSHPNAISHALNFGILDARKAPFYKTNIISKTLADALGDPTSFGDGIRNALDTFVYNAYQSKRRRLGVRI